MASNPYLLSAYAIILLTFAGYAWSLAARLKRLRAELAASPVEALASDSDGG